MGFNDTWDDSSGGNFIGKEEKAELLKEGTVLNIKRVTHNEGGQFGPKYVINFDLDGEERAMSFTAGSVESRDRKLAAMIAYFETPDADETVPQKLVQIKRSVVLKAPDWEPSDGEG